MSKKQNAAYTIVYVFGPTRFKQDYLDNKVLNRELGGYVKIGKTDFDGSLEQCTEEILKKTAIARCSQEAKTGISDWCDIYDTFIFPQLKGGNIDDIIRNILCNDVYSLDNSKAEYKECKGDIKPGKEFVYGVSRNHIKHAIESYCYQLVVNAAKENLSEIQLICKLNSIINDDEDESSEDNDSLQTRQNRDIDLILSPGDIVYLIDSRNKNHKVYDSKGNQIEATYIGRKKFQYAEEEPKFGSKLALELIERFDQRHYTSINGNNCWTIDNEKGDIKSRVTLAELYDAVIEAK